MPLVKDIFQQAVDNEYFRKVLATGKNVQVVIMSIPPGGEIGEETHPDNDQTLYLAGGVGLVILDDVTSEFTTGDLVLVPAGAKHNVITQGDKPMKIITTYSPPHHPKGTIHKTKAEADASE